MLNAVTVRFYESYHTSLRLQLV